MGNVILGSPLTFAIMLRGVARWCFGIAGWQEDLDRGAEMARASYPTMLSAMMWRKYVFAIPYGVCCPMRPRSATPPRLWLPQRNPAMILRSIWRVPREASRSSIRAAESVKTA